MTLLHLLTTILIILFTVNFVQAQEPPSEAQGDEPSSNLQRILQEQNLIIRRLYLKIDQLERRVEEVESDSQPIAESREQETTESDIHKEELLQTTEAERREQERLVRTAFERTLIERRGLLLPPGTLDLEPSFSYTHSSSDNIIIDGFTILPVLVIGDIISEKVQRETLQTSLTARIGLPWDAQFDVRVPYNYQKVRKYAADNTEISDTATDLGDITISLSRQLIRGEADWPDLLGSLRWKTRTGTSPFDTSGDGSLATGSGYDSLNLSFTGVKVVDPIVYFGSINYSYNIPHKEEVGRYNPGNSIGFSLGMAIALNLNSSLSFSYDQQFTQRSQLDGDTVPGSYLTTGVFSAGGSYTLSDNLSVDLSLGIGVTADSPDVQIGLSFPYRWRN